MENVNNSSLKLGTRNSPLAMIQTHMVINALKAIDPQLSIEIVPIVTSGDKYLTGRLSDMGGKGLFVKELQESLLSGTIDFAVHSAKDMETFIPDTFDHRAVLLRGAVEDVFVSNKVKRFQDLPQGAIVGTSSLRRGATLLNLRPDFNIKILRGNVPTRLAKLDAGEYDGIILARAGLQRLSLNDRITQILPIELMVPSAAQGILAVEFLKNRQGIAKLMDGLVHEPTALSFSLERAFLGQVDGTCHTPVGCHTKIINDLVEFYGACATIDGRKIKKESAVYPKDQALDAMLDQGQIFKKWLEANT